MDSNLQMVSKIKKKICEIFASANFVVVRCTVNHDLFGRWR